MEAWARGACSWVTRPESRGGRGRRCPGAGTAWGAQRGAGRPRGWVQAWPLTAVVVEVLAEGAPDATGLTDVGRETQDIPRGGGCPRTPAATPSFSWQCRKASLKHKLRAGVWTLPGFRLQSGLEPRGPGNRLRGGVSGGAYRRSATAAEGGGPGAVASQP